MTAFARDCEFTAAPDSGHSVWPQLSGWFVGRRVQQPDPMQPHHPRCDRSKRTLSGVETLMHRHMEPMLQPLLQHLQVLRRL